MVSRKLFILLTLVSSSSWALDDAELPNMYTVEPKSGRPGDVLRIKGVNLGPDRVEAVYLSDHKFDLQVRILAHEASSLTFRIPPFAKPGRQVLVVLTKEKEPKMVEQRLHVRIDLPPEPATSGQ